ncbi:hypothetical protein PG996_007773 [Apiospora saccharicola]|uniref:Uncharacterized protein n=1 Tax=Apiospora saccharicola TaxID=335842 RepID=A0ABR1UW02_9PEZI
MNVKRIDVFLTSMRTDSRTTTSIPVWDSLTAEAVLKIQANATTMVANMCQDVENFDAQIWDDWRVRIATKGNCKKFISPGSDSIRKTLLVTNGNELAKGGRTIDWVSENMLGEVLMLVRDAIPEMWDLVCVARQAGKQDHHHDRRTVAAPKDYDCDRLDPGHDGRIKELGR